MSVGQWAAGRGGPAVAAGRRRAAGAPEAPFWRRAAAACVPAALAARAPAALLRRFARRHARKQSQRPRTQMAVYQEGGVKEDWERIGADGQKEILIKSGATYQWVKDGTTGTYRFTDWGYESRNPDGTWVSHAQLPSDVTHLTDAQIQRLVKELRGESGDNADAQPEDEAFKKFVPKASVPPLEKWLFHGVAISDELKATKEHLKGYENMAMTDDLQQAFFLSSRWKMLNEGRRHLGYGINDSLEDIAFLNGCVIALKAITDQLKRLVKFRKRKPNMPEPSDAARLRELRVDGILGTQRGSAMAMWLYNESSKRAYVDIVIGDDGMDKGPEAEETMLRVVAGKAAELGAEVLWCRSRQTESGMEFVPKYMKTLGFKPIPEDEQEDEEWETMKVKERVEIVEQVPSLNIWLSGRGLERHLDKVNAWCKEMGALDLNELVENKEDLVEFLGDDLTHDEREMLLRK
ncbi:unnamed protein product [Prorocentrum cordatum]|uniref:Uncharacterized protein n=1 Tax=Prorocentrum cordatum TaxID=2364126 RepID=A0ABN9V2I1_9DINO|nr:unnamed protein product [Polarella glacialis]